MPDTSVHDVDEVGVVIGITAACEPDSFGDMMMTRLTRCAAEGWQDEKDGTYGFAFIAGGAERRLVNLTPAERSESVGMGHAFLAGCGGVNPTG